MKEGAAAEQAVSEAGRRTKARRDLARTEGFDEVSPEVGQLDEDAFDDAMRADPDAALALLADLTGATDEKLRALARRLAGRIMVDVARRGRPRPRRVGRLVRRHYRDDGGELDLEPSLEAIAVARATGVLVDPADLVVRDWAKPGTGLCLLVDRSGSMTGRPLAAAAVAAAAVATRAGTDYSVVAFASDAVVAKSQDVPRATDSVVTDVLTLRGFGTTDLALALRTAGAQLERSTAGRRIVVLLSDCRATVPGDAHRAAGALEELVVLAPAGDSAEAEAFAAATGARLATIRGPMDLPAALEQVL